MSHILILKEVKNTSKSAKNMLSIFSRGLKYQILNIKRAGKLGSIVVIFFLVLAKSFSILKDIRELVPKD
ncbi:hypothetical protein NMY3_03209 [Candidatus Nitrosocosmicus oleophilus]|uniref:Uncharacterized protein n=1 Tax=Candidatus Nitrosocosmicus oleophilus TaxID=1353260 RepID=A0A654M0N9_9ARCH|nr:hypothetical protein NMY3_03209 [Candidatus Nitrosocosmicus oleophilus]